LKNATLIYNPTAGRNPRKRERQVREAAEVLEKTGIRVSLSPTTGPDSARELAHTLNNQGDPFIIVCGGDGTINEVINGIAPGNAILGILPGGTANIFAKELGLPHNPVRAARALGTWSPRRIALGRATWLMDGGQQSAHRYFFSLAGIGFDAHIVHKLSLEFKRDWGVLAYVLEATRQATHYSFPSFVCRVRDLQINATFAVVQRTKRYAGWLRIAPTANVFEANFSLCVFKSRHWLRYFIYAAAVVARQHLRHTDVEIVQTQKVVCESERTTDFIRFELDGELVGQLPATFDIIPDALTILAPSESRQ